MEDQAIIALYWKRDQEAIRQTDLQYGSRLQHLSYSILFNEEDAKESVNDTYWKTWDTIPPNVPTTFSPTWQKSAGISPWESWTGTGPKSEAPPLWN